MSWRTRHSGDDAQFSKEIIAAKDDTVKKVTDKIFHFFNSDDRHVPSIQYTKTSGSYKTDKQLRHFNLTVI